MPSRDYTVSLLRFFNEIYMYHNNHLACLSGSQCYPSFFEVIKSLVKDRKLQGIKKNLLRLLERDPMFLDILSIFLGIPIEDHITNLRKCMYYVNTFAGGF